MLIIGHTLSVWSFLQGIKIDNLDSKRNYECHQRMSSQEFRWRKRIEETEFDRGNR